ncbi:MAG: hypothetical protein M3Y91_11425 [Actinomycetota bacterium]|nr:hypothetical protein [Actinomycetota bacterium]
MHRTARLAFVLAGALSLTATACGGSSHTGGANGPVGNPTTTTATTSVSGGGTPKPIVAPQDTSNTDGDQIQAAITQLKRQSGVMVLSFTVTVVTMAQGHDNWQVAEFFSSIGAPHDLGDSVYGVYLLDSSNQKKYLVATDAQGNCACSTNLNDTFIKDGQSTALTATFAAPPPNVTSVDVNVPHFGPFLGVPISG